MHEIKWKPENLEYLLDYEIFVDDTWGSKTTDNPSYDILRDLFIMSTGLGGESGEVLEKIKKYVRDGAIDRELLKKELGDVLYYLTKIAHTFDMTLKDVIEGNKEKLRGRIERGTMHGSGDER